MALNRFYVSLTCMLLVSSLACKNKDKGDSGGGDSTKAKDTVVPTVATPDIVVENITNTTATVTWKEAKDDRDGHDKLSYLVVMALADVIGDVKGMVDMGLDVSGWLKGATKADIKGLVPNRRYYVNILVMDEAGNQSGYKSTTIDTLKEKSPDTIDSYAADCAERLGELPTFSCMDGKIIPITIDDKEIKPNLTAEEAAQYDFASGKVTCDRPSLLELGPQGRCVPYARVGRLKSYNKDGSVKEEVDTVFTCRRYVARLGQQTYDGQTMDGSEYPLFEDINMLQHNRKTGETCVFQVFELGGTAKSYEGRFVPSPTLKELPAGAPAYAKVAKDYWGPPSLAVKIGCVACHDNDPFVHSNYIDQVKNDDGTLLVPAMDWQQPEEKRWSGRYSFLGNRGFDDWPTVYGLWHKDYPTCTACHYFGNIKNCEKRALQTTGKLTNAKNEILTPNLSQTGQTRFDLLYTMPPKNSSITTKEQWEAAGYQKAVDALLDCCANPNAAGCSYRAITTLPPPYLAPE